MGDLFQAASEKRGKPLAAEVRPLRLDDVVGQSHLLAANSQLRRRVAARRLGSVILYGPSGIGKTTIAEAIAAEMGKSYVRLHPAVHGTAEIKKAAEEARIRETLVFVDEVHRFSATQQDHLLNLTEDGVFDFICATTGNPYHVLVPALVSRSTVFQLKPLTAAELESVVARAVEGARRRGVDVRFAEGAVASIARRAGGDARRAVNVVEAVTVGYGRGSAVEVSEADVAEVFDASPVPYDRNGDAHYDVISAFIKSMRGSDPDATLYWLARLIHSGEDPRYISRRIMIHASEDVGLADNTALQTAVAAHAAVTHVGYPEAQIILAHAALHVARAPKSASSSRGIGLAMDYVKTREVIPVPAHLRDCHYAGAKKLGVEGYDFPHDDPRGWVEQEYAPGVARGSLYQSDARTAGTFERRSDEFWLGLTGLPQARTFPEDAE